MDHATLETVLAQVHRDMIAVQSAIADCNHRLRELEVEQAKLKSVETYLTSIPIEQPSAASHPTVSHPTTESVTADAICQKATELIRSKGHGAFVRAIDVAKALVPNYDRKTDERDFENRVYAVLKRRPEEFTRQGRGEWTLKAHGLPASMIDDDFEEPPINSLLANKAG